MPGTATLDGRALHDLPVGEATSETTCLSPADAQVRRGGWPATSRATAGCCDECRMLRRVVANGRFAIAGVCPPSDEGQAGKLSITGGYRGNRYNLHFTTVAHGAMGFTGTMHGRRTRPCHVGD